MLQPSSLGLSKSSLGDPDMAGVVWPFFSFQLSSPHVTCGVVIPQLVGPSLLGDGFCTIT